MRSTMAPEISAAVMMQNVAWKAMYSAWGIVSGTIAPVSASPTSFSIANDMSPSQLLPGDSASE